MEWGVPGVQGECSWGLKRRYITYVASCGFKRCSQWEVTGEIWKTSLVTAVILCDVSAILERKLQWQRRICKSSFSWRQLDFQLSMLVQQRKVLYRHIIIVHSEKWYEMVCQLCALHSCVDREDQNPGIDMSSFHEFSYQAAICIDDFMLNYLKLHSGKQHRTWTCAFYFLFKIEDFHYKQEFGGCQNPATLGKNSLHILGCPGQQSHWFVTLFCPVPCLQILCCLVVWLDWMFGIHRIHQNVKARIANLVTLTLKLYQTQQQRESRMETVRTDLPGLGDVFKCSLLFSWWSSLLGWLLLSAVKNLGIPPAMGCMDLK